ncbi:RHS repeat-associated core domain-containing protein [Bacteroidales bacterium OttesenSCG-928-J16]|nr:RHS repeat-associated core domain-containing protein [Bacteroidales bacterium OttesenSCG-928-J16]
MAAYIQSEGGKGGQNGLYYLATDLLGSITAIVPAGNGTIEYRSYDAWGRLRNPDDWTYNNVSAFSLIDRGYTFHEHLPEFGLINMNGRMYDPLVARFLSPDPYVQDDIAGSQGFNRYSYCFNNPLKYTDPTGEMVPYYSNGSNVIYFPDDVDGVWMHEGYRVPMTGGGDVFGARTGEEWEYYENIGSYVSYRSRETGDYLNEYEGSFTHISSEPWSSNVFEFGCSSYSGNSSSQPIQNISDNSTPLYYNSSTSLSGTFCLGVGVTFEIGAVTDFRGNRTHYSSLGIAIGADVGVGYTHTRLAPGTTLNSFEGFSVSVNGGYKFLGGGLSVANDNMYHSFGLYLSPPMTASWRFSFTATGTPLVYDADYISRFGHPLRK